MTELVRRHRERTLIDFDDSPYSPAGMGGYVRGGGGGAKVGIETAATIGAYGGAIDGRYTLLEDELRSFYMEKWGKDLFVIKGEVPIIGTSYVYYIAGFNPTKEAAIPADRLADYKADKNFYDTWELDLKDWRVYWADLRDSVPVPLLTAPFIADKLAAYDAKQRDWQKLADGRGIKTTTPPAPPKTDKDGNLIGSFGGLGDLAKNITWIVGLGLVFYVFTMFIAPPLLSGAARTKEGYRGLRG